MLVDPQRGPLNVASVCSMHSVAKHVELYWVPWLRASLFWPTERIKPTNLPGSAWGRPLRRAARGGSFDLKSPCPWLLAGYSHVGYT